MFRQTLLCHQDILLPAAPLAARLPSLYAASAAKPVSAKPDLSSGVAEEFRGGRGTGVTTAHPLTKAVMLLLAEAWPQTLSIPDLLAGASRLTGEPPDPEGLSQILMATYAAGVIELHAQPLHCVARVSQFPVASELARSQARRGRLVTTARHATIEAADEKVRTLIGSPRRHPRCRRSDPRTRTGPQLPEEDLASRHPGKPDAACRNGRAGWLRSGSTLRKRLFRNPQQAVRDQRFENRQELPGRRLPGDHSHALGILQMFAPTGLSVALRRDLRQPWLEHAFRLERPVAAQRKNFGNELAVAHPVQHTHLRVRRKEWPHAHQLLLPRHVAEFGAPLQQPFHVPGREPFALQHARRNRRTQRLMAADQDTAMEQETHLAPRPDLVPVEDILQRRILAQERICGQVPGIRQRVRGEHQIELRLFRPQPQPEALSSNHWPSQSAATTKV